MNTIEDGRSFGEQALIYNKPRLATIICEKNCHFAVLNKIDFIKILKDCEAEKLILEYKFMSKKFVFRGWHMA